MLMIKTINEAPKKSTKPSMYCPPYGENWNLEDAFPISFDSVVRQVLENYRRDVYQSDEESNKRNSKCCMRRLDTRELITNGRDDAGTHRDVAADAKHEKHEEEQHRKDLQKNLIIDRGKGIFETTKLTCGRNSNRAIASG